MKRLGIVVETHPEDYSVDLVMADNGERITGAKIKSPTGSNRTGSVDLPDVTPMGNKWDITKRNKDQDVIAIVDYIGRVAIVDGFLLPEINQMLFSDKKMAFYRHQSDVYQTIDGYGNIELRHPSGAFVRIGETPESVDLTSKNYDSSLAIDRNTGRKVDLRIELSGNVARLTMSKTGECELLLEKSFTLRAKENIDMKADGDVSIEAGGAFSIKAGSTLDTESGGNTTLKAPTVQADANFDVTGSTSVKAITSNGKNISDSHTHIGVTPGPGVTGVVS